MEIGYTSLEHLRRYLIDYGLTPADISKLMSSKPLRQFVMDVVDKTIVPMERPIVVAVPEEKIQPKEIKKNNTIITNLKNELEHLREQLIRAQDYSLQKVKHKSGVPKFVDQFSLDMKLVNTFSSMAEASRVTKITMTGIRNCLIGVQRQSGGYYWKPASTIPPKICGRCGAKKQPGLDIPILPSGRVRSYCDDCQSAYQRDRSKLMRLRHTDPIAHYLSEYENYIDEKDITEAYNHFLALAEHQKIGSLAMILKSAYTNCNKWLKKEYKERCKKGVLSSDNNYHI